MAETIYVLCEGAHRDLLPSHLMGFDIRLLDRKDNIPADARLLVVDVDLQDPFHTRKLGEFRKIAARHCLPVFAVSKGDFAQEMQANTLGARRIVTRPIDEITLARIIEAENENAGKSGGFGVMATRHVAKAVETAFEDVRNHKPVNLEQITQSGAELAQAVGSVGIHEWLSTVRVYHQSTFQHIMLVTGIACSFAQALGMSEQDVQKITMAGLLHDIGKVFIPASILDKPGKLEPDEIAVIRTHPAAGYDHLKKQGGVDEDVLLAVRHHHEFMDGSGYPDRLSGNQIGDLTRILTICDILGALLERRPYKPPFSIDKSLAILWSMAREGKIEMALVHALTQIVERGFDPQTALPPREEIDMAPLYMAQ